MIGEHWSADGRATCGDEGCVSPPAHRVEVRGSEFTLQASTDTIACHSTYSEGRSWLGCAAGSIAMVHAPNTVSFVKLQRIRRRASSLKR